MAGSEHRSRGLSVSLCARLNVICNERGGAVSCRLSCSPLKQGNVSKEMLKVKCVYDLLGNTGSCNLPPDVMPTVVRCG